MNEIIKKNGIKFGIIGGLFSIIFTSSMYFIDLKLFTNIWLGFIKITVFLVIAIILLNKTKKELNNIFSFKEAFTTYFICFLICILLATLFEILLFNVIDPSLKETIKELSIESAVDMMKKFGTQTSKIKEAVEEMSKTSQFDSLQILKGSAFSIVISSIFGLILAAIFKSRQQDQY